MIFLNILVVLTFIAIGIVLLLFTRGFVVFETDDEDDFILTARLLFLTYRIYPEKEISHVNIRRFTPRRYRKLLQRDYEEQFGSEEGKGRKRRAAEDEYDDSDDPDDELERSILDMLKIVAAVIKVFLKRFAKHVKIKVARIHINVATGDAASTAILYGVTVQSAAYIVELLDSLTTLKGINNKNVIINADYLSESSTFDMKIVFSLRIWQILSIIFGVYGKAIIKLIETSPHDDPIFYSRQSVRTASNPNKKQGKSRSDK